MFSVVMYKCSPAMGFFYGASGELNECCNSSHFLGWCFFRLVLEAAVGVYLSVKNLPAFSALQ
jgi:hypothetical protein